MSSGAAYSHYEAKASQLCADGCAARIACVDEGSPAERAGLRAGDVLTHVEGAPLRDIIEWRWWADGFEVEVTCADGRELCLERDFGEQWGIEFDDVIFDGLITCCNACTFCFMTMLPKGMRPTMYVRDDDYRLSFLQGNFVTLTNVDDDELARIIEYGLSPLHVSLHAVGHDARRELIGKNEARGLEVLEALLDAGIEVHTQIVVVPGVNDAAELVRTLAWIERNPGVLSCGLVPLGYTRFQERFASSFSDDPDAAAQVIEVVREFQEDSHRERRCTKYHLADEFYLDAGYDFPPAAFYDGYPQFEDGIGMMRSFIDEWEESAGALAQAAASMRGHAPATIVTGEAFARVLGPLVEASPLAQHLLVLPVANEFFGGNVDVTCLLTGEDVVAALAEARPQGVVLLSRQLLNPDGHLLDDMPLSQVVDTTGCDIVTCTYTPDEIIDALMAVCPFDS